MLSIDGVGEATATNLYQGGFRSVDDIAGAGLEELVQIKGISEEKAKKLAEEAKTALENVQNNQVEVDDTSDEDEALREPGDDIEDDGPLRENEGLK